MNHLLVANFKRFSGVWVWGMIRIIGSRGNVMRYLFKACLGQGTGGAPSQEAVEAVNKGLKDFEGALQAQTTCGPLESFS